MCSVFSTFIFTLCTSLTIGELLNHSHLHDHSQSEWQNSDSDSNKNQSQSQIQKLTSVEGFYEKCGTATGCFGITPQCVRSRSCTALVTFKRIDDDNFQLELVGKISGLVEGKYVAVGFSKDQKMGTDSVIGCFVNGSKQIQVGEFFNVNDTKWSAAVNRVSQVSPISHHTRTSSTFGSYTDGYLHCQFTLNHLIDLTDSLNTIYDLNKERVYLMLAQAEKGASEEQLNQHDKREVSRQPIYLSESKILDEYALYDGCGFSKGCFALPSEDCIYTKNCSLFLGVRNLPNGEKNGFDFEFELVGTAFTEQWESYIAVGISDDVIMGEDSVIGCFTTPSGEIKIDEFFNPSRYNTHVNRTGEVIFGNPFTSYKDGVIHCTFSVKASIPSLPGTNKAFNLLSDKVHLMLSRGQKKPDNLGKHPTSKDRLVSPDAISLSEKKIFRTRAPEAPITTTTTTRTTATTEITTKKTKPPTNSFASSHLSSTPGNYKCKSAGCFGLPNGCIKDNNCDLFASYQKMPVSSSLSDPEKTLELQLIGKMSSSNAKKGYIAIGFSHDNKMGEDSVFACYLTNGGHNPVEVGEYCNVKGSANNQKVIRKDGKILFVKTAASFNDSFISCRFNINPNIVLQTEIGRTFNLTTDPVFLLLSRGSEADSEHLGQHSTARDKGSTSEDVLLSKFGVVGAKSSILIQLHGTLMIVAWILLVPVGMYTARYFKQTFTTVTKTKAFWFWVHQICMFSAVLFTAISIALIVIEVQDWTISTPATMAEMYHPILGVCVFALSFLQIFIAFLRPEPSSSKRVYFNWFHWIVGTSAWLLAIASIHLAYHLKKTNLASEVPQYIETLYIFIVLHFILHLIISIHTCTADQHYEIVNTSRALIPGPMKPSGTSYEYKGTSLRASLLTLEILVCSIATLILSTFVFSSLE